MAKAETTRRDIYAEVTNKIIVDMEAGIVPWVRPWSADAVAMTVPRNATTSRAYSGVNVLLLWIALRDNAFTQNRWATFKQIQAAGGIVRKGSKGTTVVYASTFVNEAEKARAAAANDKERAIPFLKSFTVFNLDQCDGVNHLRVEDVRADEKARDEFGDKIAALSPVTIHHGGDSAFYTPSHDFIQMPVVSAFEEPVEYARTLAHEIVHSTGHKSRLDRKIANRFGSQKYADEELVAELGSAFICANYGVEPSVRHAAYLHNWIRVLKEDSRAIFRAASAATKAADFVLATAVEDEEPMMAAA